MGVRAHSRMPVCPTGSYCLLPVMSLAPLPGRASGGVGKKKKWESAELWDKEPVTAHQTDPFAHGSTPVDAGCDPRPTPPPPNSPCSQQSRNKKVATQTLRQRQQGQWDISTTSKTEQDHRHWLISNNHRNLFSLECKWVKPSQNKTATNTTDGKWTQNKDDSVSYGTQKSDGQCY